MLPDCQRAVIKGVIEIVHFHFGPLLKSRKAVVVSLAMVMFLAGLGSIPAVAASSSDFAGLQWADCADSGSPAKECATLVVPLDYDKPNGRKAQIAMSRIPAASGEPIGSLFFNPGGPGGAGAAIVSKIASGFSEDVLDSFDIVSWDPRGIGESRPALQSCDMPLPLLNQTGAVKWSRSLDRTVKQLGKANRKCQRLNEDFINHLGTKNVARDLERMRIAVGDSQLSYYGASYGTRIGYTYAVMFPNRVRAMVLDGNISPKSDYADLVTGARGPDLALDFLKKNSRSTFKAFNRGDRALQDKTIRLGAGERFTRWDYRQVATDLLAKTVQLSQVPKLAEKVEQALSAGQEAEEARRVLASLKPESNENAGGPFSIVNCLDYADRIGKSTQLNLVKKMGKGGPLGGLLAMSYAPGCSGLKLNPEPVPDMSSKRLRARVAEIQVVLANATRDTLTPKFWAKKMKSAFAQQSFIQQHSTQHVIWLGNDSCVTDPIDNYVINRKLPNPRTCAWRGISPLN